jgi:hypothetical protein
VQPYGWWHEFSSTAESVSITQRWNPYQDELRKFMIAKHRMQKMFSSQSEPAESSLRILLQATDLPVHVQEIMLTRILQEYDHTISE